METRRLEAAQDLLGGLTQSKVARKYGVSRTTASRWHRSLSLKGAEGLRKRRATGRPCRLTKEQLARIPAIYAEGAVVHGFPDQRWTTARMASVIEARLGVHYDNDHVGRLMHKLGLRQPGRRRTRVMPPFAAYAAAATFQPSTPPASI
ncbi:MAG: helix-turn-helix domain-containing protein [Bryobacteraceae bacterium]